MQVIMSMEEYYDLVEYKEKIAKIKQKAREIRDKHCEDYTGCWNHILDMKERMTEEEEQSLLKLILEKY